MVVSPTFMAVKLIAFLSTPPRSLLKQYIQPSSEQQTSDALDVVDRRTGRRYQIPIKDNAIDGNSLRAINDSYSFNPIDRYTQGLKVYDPGFENTAVKKSHICHV